jgi:hypothetical protein
MRVQCVLCACVVCPTHTCTHTLICTQALPPVAARAVEAEDEARHFLQAVAPPLVHTATGEVCICKYGCARIYACMSR